MRKAPPQTQFGPVLVILIGVTTLLSPGCAEGPLWKTGKYLPWIQDQWAEEEKIADTLFSQKRELSEITEAVVRAPIDEKEKVADRLSEVYKHSRIVLLQLHAVHLLGKLDCPTAIETLGHATADNHSEIRLAAIKAWEKMPADKAIPQLQKILGSDTDIDVRLAATRALAEFPGQASVTAISLALNDPDPALQLRAAESLKAVTNEDFGYDIQAWQNYLSQSSSPTIR